MTGQFDQLVARLADPGLSGERIVKLTTEYAELTPVVEAARAYDAAHPRARRDKGNGKG